MPTLQPERDRLSQSNWKEYFLSRITKDVFIQAYLFQRNDSQIVSTFTALVPISQINDALKDPSWDLAIGDGRPGTVTYHQAGRREARYFRFGNEKGIEPLLRVPLTDDQAEFDAQVLALARILIESLNEEKIQEALPKKEVNAKGIKKLEAFLKMMNLENYGNAINFLRNLHDLREGSAHRKGKKFKRAATRFHLDDQGLSRAFESILREAVSFLRLLDSGFPEGINACSDV